MRKFNRLEPGQYRAITQVTISRLLDSVEKEQTEYPKGRIFEIPVSAPRWWHAVLDDSEDFGGQIPCVELVR